MKSGMKFDWIRNHDYQDSEGNKLIISKRAQKRRGFNDRYEKYWFVLVQVDENDEPLKVEIYPKEKAEFFSSSAEMDFAVENLIEERGLIKAS